MWLLRRPVDSFAGLIAAGGTAMILVNALFLQSGPHPAPIFANKPPPPLSATTRSPPPMPRCRVSVPPISSRSRCRQPGRARK